MMKSLCCISLLIAGVFQGSLHAAEITYTIEGILVDSADPDRLGLGPDGQPFTAVFTIDELAPAFGGADCPPACRFGGGAFGFNGTMTVTTPIWDFTPIVQTNAEVNVTNGAVDQLTILAGLGEILPQPASFGSITRMFLFMNLFFDPSAFSDATVLPTSLPMTPVSATWLAQVGSSPCFCDEGIILNQTITISGGSEPPSPPPPTAVPEPAAWEGLLMGLALSGVALARRTRLNVVERRNRA